MNKPAPKIYRTTNWSSYNRALINRGNISIWFDPNAQWYAQSQGKQGRNQTHSDTAIQCCFMIKSLFRLSLRMVTGFVQSLLKLCGLDWIAPDYSIICRRQKHIDIVISDQISSAGLHLLVDSTGLKCLGEGEWKCKKHGAKFHRQWRKLHIAIDAETLQIRASLQRIMSVIRKCSKIYLLKFPWMNKLILFIQMVLMTQSIVDKSF